VCGGDSIERELKGIARCYERSPLRRVPNYHLKNSVALEGRVKNLSERWGAKKKSTAGEEETTYAGHFERDGV